MDPTYFVKHPDDTYSEANPKPISQAAIDEMVNRFLCWKLPADFAPDAGISFQAEYNAEYMAKQGKPPCRHEPTGTNLFHAVQARQMIEHLLGVVTETPNAGLERTAHGKGKT